MQETIVPEAYCPPLFQHVWEWWLELAPTYRANEHGMLEPLTYGMIRDWAAMTKRSPSREELGLLFGIDGEFRKKRNKQQRSTASPSSKEPVMVDGGNAAAVMAVLEIASAKAMAAEQKRKERRPKP